MSPPPHGFTVAEHEQRLARAQGLMHDHGLDGLLVTTPEHIRYVTGFVSEFYASPTRPWFVVVPAAGRPIAVIPEIGGPEMARTWIDDIRTWPAPRPEDDGTSLLAQALQELPRRTGRIGVEIGREMAMRMPVAQFLELRQRLAGLELVDGSPCLWRIRAVKSAAEIERIAHVCQLASRAYGRVPELVRPGESERDAARALKLELLRQGADAVPFLPAIAGPGGVPQIVCGPSDRRLVPGDVLFFDTGATYDGYFCDFDRTFAVGRLDDGAKRAQDLVWRATEAGIAAVRVGATTDDLYRAMAKVLAEAGAIGGNVGRLGHGLGLQLTEPPSHRIGDGTVLEAGMVLPIEPGLSYAPGKMIVHEENLVVTEAGPVLLTERAPREMPVID